MSQTIPSIPQKKVGLLLSVGIILVPIVFAWVLLRNGYSRTAKILGFTWLAIGTFAISIDDGESNSGNLKSISPTTTSTSASTSITSVSSTPNYSPNSKPEPIQEPTVANKNVASVTAGMGVSYTQAMQHLDNQFSMEKSTPVDGKTRYMGSIPDNLAIIELIGDETDIERASFLFGLPNGVPEIADRNRLLLTRFLKNTVPEWKSSNVWIVKSVEKVVKGGEEITVIQGNKIIVMNYLPPLAMVITSITVK